LQYADTCASAKLNIFVSTSGRQVVKPSQDTVAIAERLARAAAVPLQVAAFPGNSNAKDAREEISPAPKPKIQREPVKTISLRPSRALLDHYTLAAAERTISEKRVVSAQEIMLEVLEQGRPKVGL
jgi:hypothetical protein